MEIELCLGKTSYLREVAISILVLSLAGFGWLGSVVTRIGPDGSAQVLTWSDYQLGKAEKAYQTERQTLREDADVLAKFLNEKNIPSPVVVHTKTTRILDHASTGVSELTGARTMLAEAAMAVREWSIGATDKATAIQTLNQSSLDVIGVTMQTNHQDRIYDDLIGAERNLRLSTENSARQLLALLPEIASRLDGTRYEELRKQDPTIPGRWTPNDWRNFFMSINMTRTTADAWNGGMDFSPNYGGGISPSEKITELTNALNLEKRKAEALIAENNRLQNNQPKYERKEKHQAPPASTSAALSAQPVIDELTAVVREKASYHVILANFREFMKSLSNIPLAEYRELGENNRPWKRYAGFIYLIGHWGINSKQELMRIMGDEEGIGGNSSSLINVLENLREYGYLISNVLEIEGAEMKIAFWRLASAGQVLYQEVTGTAPVECEWSRIIRIHEGEKSTTHIAACLSFAFHSRKRGWGIQILPCPQGKLDPHILMQRGEESILVRVEIGHEIKTPLLPEPTPASSSAIAFCTVNAIQRDRLIASYKMLYVSGRATDIQAISAIGYSGVLPDSDIWVETW